VIRSRGGSWPKRSTGCSTKARSSAGRWRTGSPGHGYTNLKQLRPGSSGTSEVRILFIFDPARNAVLLIAGDKSGRWQEWYREAIPAAEAIYEAYLKERP
jgi:Phage derived protein Gp49-like (DUF891)